MIFGTGKHQYSLRYSIGTKYIEKRHLKYLVPIVSVCMCLSVCVSVGVGVCTVKWAFMSDGLFLAY